MKLLKVGEQVRRQRGARKMSVDSKNEKADIDDLYVYPAIAGSYP